MLLYVRYVCEDVKVVSFQSTAPYINMFEGNNNNNMTDMVHVPCLPLPSPLTRARRSVCESS